MSGAAMVAACVPPYVRYRVQLDNSPQSLLFTPATFKGSTLRSAAATGTTFELQINGVVSQSFFDHLRVEKRGGSIVTLTAASATFSTSTFSSWVWNTGNVWDALDNLSVKLLWLHFTSA